ncbi:hypothetical protein ACFWNE_07370 [Streptomyces goshikiensis]|uniref:hypothetical protein n=1 Tax=Streptomyces goshikiensis TaxID=1942 RepID=UPI00364D16E8
MPDPLIQPFPSEPPWPGDGELISLTFPDTRDALAKWEQPDGYWSDGLTAMVAECQAGTRTAIPCPVCGRDSTHVTVDSIYPESWVEGRQPVRYSRQGRVYTLAPCGHALKR